MLIGASSFANPLDKLNPYALITGGLIGLVFGWLFRRFMRSFLGAFNRAAHQNQARILIRYATDIGMLFLAPFAVMLATSVFLLNWSMAVGFVSAGLMAVGTAATIELGKLKGKQELKNTVVTMLVSFLFSLIWTMGFSYVTRVPAWVEGSVILVRSLIAGGGMGL